MYPDRMGVSDFSQKISKCSFQRVFSTFNRDFQQKIYRLPERCWSGRRPRYGLPIHTQSTYDKFFQRQIVIFQQKTIFFNRKADFSTENRYDQVTASWYPKMCPKTIYDVGNLKNNFLKMMLLFFQQKVNVFNRNSDFSTENR